MTVGGLFNTTEGRNCPVSSNWGDVKGYVFGHTNRNPKDIDGDGDASSDITGSSTEYSLQVTNQIDGFYSASQRQSGFDQPNAPAGLTLGNTDPTNYFYGGKYGETKICIANYWRKINQIPDLNNSWLVANHLDLYDNRYNLHAYSDTSGKYKYNGDLIIHNRSGNNLNLKTTIYVDGDVWIKDNIYNNNDPLPWTHPVQIGYIFIIARGNIYIDPSVTNIDAILVAYPEFNNHKQSGQIWTCDPAGLDQYSHYSACWRKLVINGALIAQNLHLGRFTSDRDSGDVGTVEAIDCLETSSHFVAKPSDPITYCVNPKNRAGEEINLLPEYYIGLPSLPAWDEWMYERDSFAIKALNW